MREARHDVAIVGAGVGGAALALALASRYPVSVLLLERQPGPGNLNRGDSLLPATTGLLSGWGVSPRLRAAGARPLDRMEVHDARAGLLFAAPLPSPEHAPYLVLPHPQIERTLVEAALATGRVEVRYRRHATGLVEEGGRVTGIDLQHGRKSERVLARLVVGADGSSSVVRGALGIPLPRRSYRHAYYGLDVERPADYAPAMRIELTRAGGVLVVPSPDPSRVGLGVLVHPQEHDVYRSGSLQAKLDAIRRRSPFLEGCTNPGPAPHLYRLSCAHAPRYVAAGAVLLGDAVHVVDPTGGQGMTLAVEDAAALARHSGPALAGGDLDRALAAYERERRPKNAFAIAASGFMSRVYAWPGPGGDRIRRLVFEVADTGVGRRIHRYLWMRMAGRCEGAA